MTSASSNSIYCKRPPAYRVLRLAGPCILFSAHNSFFYMHINNGLPSEEGKGFLSNESKSKQGRDPTQSVQGGIVLSSSKKMRVSVSSSCNTGTPNAAVGRICSRRRFLLNLCRYAWQLVCIVAQAQAETRELACETIIQVICMKSLSEHKIFYSAHATSALTRRTMASSAEVNAREYWDLKGKLLWSLCRHPPVCFKIKHTGILLPGFFTAIPVIVLSSECKQTGASLFRR